MLSLINIFNLAVFYNLTCINNSNLVADLSHNTQIMGDHDHSCI